MSVDSYTKCLKEKIMDMTECAICTDTLENARMLPCFHSFCLKCLQDYVNDNKTGDEVKCPCCRKLFKLTSGGVDALPINHFINKLIDVSALPENTEGVDESKELNCDSCLAIYGEKSAAGYCLECAEYLCTHCIQRHKLAKVFKQHKTFPLDQLPNANELLKMTVNNCEDHPHHQIDFYCNECKTTACLVCYMAKHKEHRCSDIKEASEALRKKTNEDVERFKTFMKKTEDIVKQIDLTDEDFQQQIKIIEEKVKNRFEELQTLLESQYRKLNRRLGDLKIKRQKELGMMKEEAEHEILMLRSFERYWSEVEERGSACDVVQAASNLQRRVDELEQLHEERHLEREDKSRVDYYGIKFNVAESFTVTDTEVVGDLNPIGAIRELVRSNLYQHANWKQLMKTAKADILREVEKINGMAASEKEVYLTLQDQTYILVHDLLNPAVISRKIHIPNLTTASGVIYNSKNASLYVSNQINPSYIHKINLVDDSLSGWDVTKGQPYGLSLSQKQNLLVGFYDVGLIEEYNVEGELVRNVKLGGGITGTCKVMERNNGNFILWQLNPESRLCMADATGRIIKSKSLDENPKQLNHRTCVELDAFDYLLVSDSNTGKLRIFNLRFDFEGELDALNAQGVTSIRSFCWDKANGRLIVGTDCGYVWAICSNSSLCCEA